MRAELGPLYDAFVVRMWRDAATGRLLRAEVEHAGTGAITRAAGVTAGWVFRQIVARLAERLPGEAPALGMVGGGPGSTPNGAVQSAGATRLSPARSSGRPEVVVLPDPTGLDR